MRTYKVEAIVLGSLDLGEADRILTLFTRQHGKLKVVAKGVRRLTSRKAASLNDFNQVKVVLARGRSLDIITEVELLNSFQAWRNDLVRVGLAYYLTEVASRLTAEGQENMAVYNSLTTSLNRLDKFLPVRLVRTFEEEVLVSLGFGIPPGQDAGQKSLVDYIEEIIEGEIKSKEVLRKIKNERFSVSKN